MSGRGKGGRFGRSGKKPIQRARALVEQLAKGGAEAIKAAEGLHRLASKENLADDAIREVGGIPKLVECLHQGSSSQVAIAACGALAKIGWGDVAGEKTINQDAIREAGAIPLIAEMLKAEPGSKMLMHATEAVWNLATNIENARRFRNAGVISHLVRMLSGPTALAWHAAGALTSLANYYAMQGPILNAGAVEKLLDLLRLGPQPKRGYPHLKESAAVQAARVLACLADANGDAVETIQSAKGVEVLCSLVSTRRSFLSDEVITVLRVMLDDDGRCEVDESVVTDMVAAFTTAKFDVHEARHALIDEACICSSTRRNWLFITKQLASSVAKELVKAACECESTQESVDQLDELIQMRTPLGLAAEELLHAKRMLRMTRNILRIAAGMGVEPPRLPEEFVCPITRSKMLDPVVASDGHTYEREAIERVLGSDDARSPLTREPLDEEVYPNRALRTRIVEHEIDWMSVVADARESVCREMREPIQALLTQLDHTSCANGLQGTCRALLDKLGEFTTRGHGAEALAAPASAPLGAANATPATDTKVTRKRKRAD